MINVSRLSLSHGGKVLFKDLSFHLGKGQIAAIMGTNGRGKTTLLRAILGLIPSQQGDTCLSAEVAYVPQQESITFPYTVRTMVMLGRVRHMRWYASPGIVDRDITQSCLELMGLLPLADKPFDQLSGGERQLVCIARALASEPEIIILDEPASALDLSNQDRVLSTLRALSTRQGITVLFTTHSPQHAQHIADNTLLLYPEGEYLYGPSGEILTDEPLTRLYTLPIHVAKVNYQQRVLEPIIPIFSDNQQQNTGSTYTEPAPPNCCNVDSSA